MARTNLFMRIRTKFLSLWLEIIFSLGPESNHKFLSVRPESKHFSIATAIIKSHHFYRYDRPEITLSLRPESKDIIFVPTARNYSITSARTSLSPWTQQFFLAGHKPFLRGYWRYTPCHMPLFGGNTIDT